MRIAIIVITFLVVILSVVYYVTGYRSAFEADQACHYELIKKDSLSISFACDHDLETRQWLLYEKGLNSEPSKVIERFRY